MDKFNLKKYIEKTGTFRNGLIYKKKLDKIPEEIIAEINKYGFKDLYTNIVAILGDIKESPKCLECNKEVKLNPKKLKSGEWVLSDRKYCSKKCNQHSLIAKKKREDTCLNKYGSRNIFSSETGKEKIKKTNLKKYGVDNPQKNEKIRKKTENTLLKKGGIGLANSLTQKKAQKTYKEKTGYNNPGSNPETVKKARETIEKKYEGLHPNRSHISEESLKKLEDKDWLYKAHIEERKTILELSILLQVAEATVKKALIRNKIEVNKYSGSSKEEKELLSYLEFLLPETNIINGDRKLIAPLELDIYIPELKIAIEYNGLYWHSVSNFPTKEEKNYHLNKTEKCLEKGIKLIHIFEDEWLYRNSQVKRTLKVLLNKNNSSVFARKCRIIKVKKQNAGEFLEENHVQGKKVGSINIGLEYGGELITLACIKNYKDYYSLERFCGNTKVVGGLNKILSFLVKEYGNKKVVTFADRRWSQGILYEKSGFRLDKTLKPDYRYVNKTAREHKFNYRHANKLKYLENYNPNKSEAENMEVHNIKRIYDCGLLKYVKVY